MRCELQCTKEALSQVWKVDLPVDIVFLMQSHTFFPVLLRPECGCLLVSAVFDRKAQPPEERAQVKVSVSSGLSQGVSCSPVEIVVSGWKMGGQENLL